MDVLRITVESTIGTGVAWIRVRVERPNGELMLLVDGPPSIALHALAQWIEDEANKHNYQRR